MTTAFPDELAAMGEGVVLTNPAILKGILEGSVEKDIDLLVGKPAAFRLIEQAHVRGYHKELKRHSPDQLLLYRYRAECDQLFMVDVIWRYRVTVGRAGYALRDDLAARCMAEAEMEPATGLKLVSPAWRLFFVLCSILLKGRKPAYYGDELTDHDGSKQAVLGGHLRSLGFVEMDADRLAAAPFMPSPRPERASLAHVLLADAFRRALRFPWYLRAFALSHRYRLMRPPFVAVVGLDGTGKSTLVDSLVTRLPIKIRRHYWASRRMILPSTRLHRWLERRLLRRDITVPQDEYKPIPEKTASALPRRRSPVRWLVLWALFANKYAEYWAKYAMLSVHRLCGTRIVTDRYVYDEWMEHADPLLKANRWLYAHAYPRPPLLVVTTAAPGDVSARRPSITPEQAAYHLAGYDELVEEIRGRGVEVLRLSSSERTPEDNLREVLRRFLAPAADRRDKTG